jgi:hypothetical protein
MKRSTPKLLLSGDKTSARRGDAERRAESFMMLECAELRPDKDNSTFYAKPVNGAAS